MSKINIILLIINLILMAGALITLMYTLAGLLFRFETWMRARWMLAGASLLLLLMVVFFLIRKSHFPVAGVDYK